VSRFFTAPDAAGDDTIWLERGDLPMPVMRECDLPPNAREFWPTIVAAFVEGES
jgi:hypothetical protein